MKKILSTPIKTEDVTSLKVGDVVYLNGLLVTCRDTGHKRRVLEGVIPKVDLHSLNLCRRNAKTVV